MPEPARNGRGHICRSAGLDRPRRLLGVCRLGRAGCFLRFWLSFAGGGAVGATTGISEEEGLQMKEEVILSDQSYDWSDRLGFIGGIDVAQTASRIVTSAAIVEGNLARLADRAVQALRQIGLQLHARTRTRSEVLLVCQPTRDAAGDGVRTSGISRAGKLACRQLSAGALRARRNLRDQPGALATTRGARIEHHVVAGQRGHWGCCYVGNQHGLGTDGGSRPANGAATDQQRTTRGKPLWTC